MKRPNEGIPVTPPTTIIRADEVDREIEALLDKIVHDSPYNRRSTDEALKTSSPMRQGLPRHEW